MELLIVMSIMSMLAALLFPVIVAVKEKGRVARCQSNLRQVGLAFEMYLQDWNRWYPNTGDAFLWMGRKWRWPLKPHLSLSADPDTANPWGSKKNNPGLLLCPSDLFAEKQWDSTSYAYSMAFFHTPEQINSMTAIEQTWSTKPPCFSQKQVWVKYPSRKAMVAEWLSNHESPHVGWNSWDGGRNYLFADGHCKYLKATQIKPANDNWPDINLTRDGISGFDID
jgi:prepilin-type processing-associated H-X9-DG protein